MSQSVAITGIGIISSIGNNFDETVASLQASRHGIGTIQHINTRHKDHIKVGEVPHTNHELAELLQLPTTTSYSRTTLLGLIAAQEAIISATLTSEEISRLGLISATSVGGMDITEQQYPFENMAAKTEELLRQHPAGDGTNKIAKHIGIEGFTTTISTACSSSANAIMLGARMIKAGQLDRVIVGGTDALSKFTINGFNSLMILSDAHCKPFDNLRKGLNLGEGAAYLVLESATTATKRQQSILGYLKGYGNANDAFHQTASSADGEGAFLAMKKALEVAQLQPSDIDYINAHGTATQNNDASESAALQRIFKDALPVFSSTKPFTGHTLAAAGAVEAVFSVAALQNNLVFPNLNFDTPMEESGIQPNLQLTTKPLQNILSNSFGFGGNCSSLIVSKNL